MMIYLQLLSTHSGSNGPIFGPYDRIDFDFKSIRLFTNYRQWADVINWSEEDKGYIYGGVIYNRCFKIVNDPREAKGFRENYEMFDSRKTINK